MILMRAPSKKAGPAVSNFSPIYPTFFSDLCLRPFTIQIQRTTPFYLTEISSCNSSHVEKKYGRFEMYTK